jgi:biotin carboxylase
MDQIPYFFIPDSNEELKAPLEFPFIVKPNFGYSSGGVQIVRSQDEFVQAVKTIRRLNRIIFGRETTSILGAICEEYVDGTEYSVDSITIQGRTKSVFGCIRRFPSENNFSDFMYISPFENYGQILSKAEEIIGALIRDIGLHSGPTHAEFRWCKKRNCLVLIEVAFRVGGVGSIGRLCFETTGIELNKLAIRSLTKQLELCELEGISSKSRLYGVSLNPEIGSGGRIREIRGKDFLNEDRSVVDYHLNKSIGDYVVPYPRGVDSLGEILVVAVTAEHLDKKIDEFLHKFKVIYETE